MPIYEYEPLEHLCGMCEGRIAVIQGVEEEPLDVCPDCGLAVRRVISTATFRLGVDIDADRAARHGLTTFRRVEKGKWEKVAGQGVDMIVGTPEDQATVDESARPKRTLDLENG